MLLSVMTTIEKSKNNYNVIFLRENGQFAWDEEEQGRILGDIKKMIICNDDSHHHPMSIYQECSSTATSSPNCQGAGLRSSLAPNGCLGEVDYVTITIFIIVWLNWLLYGYCLVDYQVMVIITNIMVTIFIII